MKRNNRAYVLGLTGRTGSGASTVAGILKARGVYIIDADKIAHDVLLPGGGAYGAVVAELGENILDENKHIDRKKVAAVVFADAEKLRVHTETTHKYILQKIEDEIPINGAVCIDAPLLVESGFYKRCDENWAVYADCQIRLKRVMSRDGLTIDEARRRMAAQMDFDEIAQYMDFIIYNDAGLDVLENAVLARMAECLEDA